MAPEHLSYWIASTPLSPYPPLPSDTTTNVVVIGAGITGITTALELQLAGRRVMLLEAARVLEGVTGNTTAKVTSAHGLIYQDLVRLHGEDKAREYGALQQRALEHIAVTAEEIPCDFVRVASFSYATTDEEREQVQAEAQTAVSLGLPASYTQDVGLPFDTLGAVRFADQARFHPRAYLIGLLNRFVEAGGVVHEQTRVTKVRERWDHVTVETERGPVRADHAVVATHLPILDRAAFFARAFPVRDYVVAGLADPALMPDAQWIGGEPKHSLRWTDSADGPLLVVGGGHHVPGRDDTAGKFDELTAWVREWAPGFEPRWTWSAQDYTSADKLPFVGRYTSLSKRLWTACAFGAWGMTNATAAAFVLRDLVLGQDAPGAALLDPNRRPPIKSWKTLLEENVKVGAELVSKSLAPAPDDDPEALAPGEAAVLKVCGRKAACSRALDGTLHVVSARCTHLGCVVGWNAAERSWDCPCHGSRFAEDGEVLQGPAVSRLPALDTTRAEQSA